MRQQAELARQGLIDSRSQLHDRRIALASFETAQRSRSQALAGLALNQADRALLYGEEAQVLEGDIGSRQQQDALAANLARLPGPLPRPDVPGAPADPPETIPYTVPVDGRLVTGVGEISDGGVHARGLTFETAAEAPVIAPAGGRIVYAAPFRRYGNVVIIDHGRDWMSVLTDLGSVDVHPGQIVARGAALGHAESGTPHVTVELRHAGRPVPIAQLLGS